MVTESMLSSAATGKRRVLIYCQHVLGMGHLIRTMAIARALEQFEVVFVNGGEALAGIEIPPWVRLVNLPPLSSDAEFRNLKSDGSDEPIEQIQQARKNRLLQLFEDVRPSALIIELFPFGRKRFAFELLPLLAHIRLDAGPTKVVCSLRDILVTKPDQIRHEEWVISLMNRHFDLLLIHSDPTFQILDETFSRCHDLRCDIQYTGFVAQEPDRISALSASDQAPAPIDGIPLILASVGGGRVGYELLVSAAQASTLLIRTRPHRMLMFTGPYMPNDQCDELHHLTRVSPHIEVRRFSPSFQALMKQAALSISMAGYNTCMNLLTTGTSGLVLPFTGHRNDEQTIRAQKLERHGWLTMLEPNDLHPDRLAAKIDASLMTTRSTPRQTINTDGAQETAVAIERLITTSHDHDSVSTSPRLSAVLSPLESWRSSLRRFLASQQVRNQALHVFLRDDDVDQDEESLKSLLDIALARSVPMNLEIIPGLLTDSCVSTLRNVLRADPSLLSLNQHGWIHANHEVEGRKCEFGPSRGLALQAEDIARGKAILESTFEDRFYPAFTPPWNRCTEDTYQVLDELGFLVLSKDRGKEPIAGYRFRDISTTLDLYTWKDGARMKSPDAIVDTMISQMQEFPLVGLLLHHKVMTNDAFRFLDQILCELASHSVVQFHTFQTVLPFVPEVQVMPR